MATNAYLTYHDGKLEVPEELREELHLKEGARLKVVASGGRIVLDQEDIKPATSDIDWHTLRGALAGINVDFNAELEADRLRENELDARLG
jgi:bifunctional DNA-binding transcriptional regulator/antitoxin component of YhaV-PrlF toxin-antitoxin module